MQPWKTGKLVFRLAAVGALIIAFALFGCSDGGNQDGFLVDVSRRLNPTLVAAVSQETFTYDAGLTFPGVGFVDATVDGPVTINFTPTALGSQATVTGENGTATANVTFPGNAGCFFRFLTSTIPDLQVTLVGQPNQGYRFDQCDLAVRSDPNTVVPGGNTERGVLVLILNGISSNEIDIDIAISDTGELIINGRATGIIITGTAGNNN